MLKASYIYQLSTSNFTKLRLTIFATCRCALNPSNTSCAFDISNIVPIFNLMSFEAAVTAKSCGRRKTQR